jgi:hypothetical protein
MPIRFLAAGGIAGRSRCPVVSDRGILCSEVLVMPRKEHEPPEAIAEWGWRYHHMGIPTDEPREGEVYLEELGLHVAGFDTSPYGVEWMRFEPGSAISELVRSVPHIAFEVDDLDRALEGKELIGEPSSPMAGVKVAMILHNGMPVELLEFE